MWSLCVLVGWPWCVPCLKQCLYAVLHSKIRKLINSFTVLLGIKITALWPGCFVNHPLAIPGMTSWGICRDELSCMTTLFVCMQNRTFKVLRVLHSQCFDIIDNSVDGTSSDMAAGWDMKQLEAFKLQIFCHF